MVAPGESLPSAELSSSMPSSTSLASGSTAATTNPAASQSAAPAHGSKISPGAIAGIVIGAVVIAVLIGTLLYFFGRHRTMIQFLKRDRHVSTQQPPGPGTMAAHNSLYTPQTPSMPYSTGDQRFGDYSTHDVPPYPKYADPAPLAELSSPELGSYRPSSPYSDTTAYDGSRRFTSSPPPKNLMDSLDTGRYLP